MKMQKQCAFFVERAGEKLLGSWSAYHYRDAVKTHLAVFRPERCLVPRSKLAYGLAASGYDVPQAEIEAWLNARGYRLVSPVLTSP